MNLAAPSTKLRRRLSAGAAALVFFAMFFALPLYAATTLCTMPCCHNGAPGAKLKADTPGCATECTITADDATVKAVSRYVAPSLVATAHAPIVSSVVASASPSSDAAPSPPASAPPLHLLNSIFRI